MFVICVIPSGKNLSVFYVEPQEDKREWLGIWRTFKNDPLQPVRDYFHQYVITGIGLFLEGYVVRPRVSQSSGRWRLAFSNEVTCAVDALHHVQAVKLVCALHRACVSTASFNGVRRSFRSPTTARTRPALPAGR